MKVHTLIISLVLSILALSCNSNRIVYQMGDRVVASCKKNDGISLSPVDFIAGECMIGVTGIYCVRDSIAVLSTSRSSYCFRMLNLWNSSYVNFLRKGRGPDEIVNGGASGIRKTGRQTLLDVSAINNQLLLSVDLCKTFTSGETVIQETTALPPQAWLSFHIGDNRILSEAIFDEDLYSLKIFDKESLHTLRTERVFGSEPYLTSLQPLFNSSMRIKPDRTRLSMAMGYFDEINIFDIEGDHHLSVSTSKKPTDEMILKEALKSRKFGNLYYLAQDVTDQHIYALYLAGQKEDERTVSTIHVFTWDGELEKVFHLDEVLTGIAVSEDESTLYGLSGEEVLYRYSLTGIL